MEIPHLYWLVSIPFLILAGLSVLWFLKTMIGGAMEYERSIQTSLTNFQNRTPVLPPPTVSIPMPPVQPPASEPVVQEKKEEPVRHLPDSSNRTIDLAD
jgi:hypothetical protein